MQLLLRYLETWQVRACTAAADHFSSQVTTVLCARHVPSVHYLWGCVLMKSVDWGTGPGITHLWWVH